MRLFAVLIIGVAVWGVAVRAQPPEYSLAGLADAASSVPARLSPNSRGTLYGNHLAAATNADVFVLIGRRVVPVTYASLHQVNFIVPGDLASGRPYSFSLSRNGLSGPEFMVDIVPESPEFFAWPTGMVLAARPDGTLIVPGSPARPGEIVILYANGLGPTVASESKRPTPPPTGDRIIARLDVWLNDLLLPPESVLYAGLAPGFLAVYQINIRLPPGAPTTPTIRLGIGGEATSRPGLRLPVASEEIGNATPP